jgi:hypothetical protein
MVRNKIKEIYLERRIKQLKQWDRVIEKLKSRADKANDKTEEDLRHHIVKIQVKKARTEVRLRQLQNEDDNKWAFTKAGLEKSWLDLRNAILRASAKPK